MRQRVEDLGRVAELLRQTFKNDVLNEFNDIQCKNIDDPRERNRCFNTKEVQNQMRECWHIARYGDDEE